MALNARASQLASQRSTFSGYRQFQGGQRALTFADRLSTLAKQTTQTELQSKIQLYNDGQISNEDMQKFLTTMQGSNSLSSKEKLEVENQIRDFQDRVRVEKLTASYKNSPENSPAKVSSAQALANFFNQKAGSLQPDTPAYSTALQSAGQWANAAKAEQDQIERMNRSTKRAALFNEVARADITSIEEAQQKAQAFSELAQQAYADGDQQAALQFDTQAQNMLQTIPKLQEQMEKQSMQEERRGIINAIADIKNQYHDGKLSGQDAAQALAYLDQRALEIGDTSLQLNINTFSDKLAKDDAKGVKRGTFNGLPVVLGKGKGSGAGGVETSWDKQDFDYSDNIRLADAMLKAGKIDSKKYSELVGMAIMERNQQLSERIETIYALAEQNPNQKIVYEGKKTRVVDVLERLYGADEDLSGQVSAYENGTFAVAQIAPKKSGTGKGKNLATFEIIDTNNLEEGRYIQDSQGIYHEIRKGTRLLSPEEAYQAAQNYGYMPDGITRVKYDESGNAYIEDGTQMVDVYEPGTSNMRSVPIDQNTKTIDDYATLVQKETQQKLDEANAPKIEAPQQGLNPNRLLPTSVQDFTQGLKGGVQAIAKDVSTAATTVKNAIPENVQQGVTNVAKTVNPVAAPIARMFAPNLSPILDTVKGVSQVAPQAYNAVKSFAAPTTLERQAGTRLAAYPNQQYNQPIKTPLLPDLKPSQILNPQTLQQKVVSGALNVGAKVQQTAQDLTKKAGSFLSGLFKR